MIFKNHNNTKPEFSDPSEIRAVHTENRARVIDGLPARTNYGVDKIDSDKLNNPPNYILPGQKIRNEQKSSNDNRIY